MLVVDAQAHIWAADTPERPWPKGKNKPHRGLASFSKEELLREMDQAGVQRAVIVTPGWEGPRNDNSLAAAKAHPDRFAVMGQFDVGDPASRGLLATWRKQPGMLGVRLVFKIDPEGGDDWLWAEAEAAGVPIMLEAGGQLELVGRAASRFPRLRFAIDRFGIPGSAKDEAAFVDLDKLIALAKFPNVAVKASALPGYSTDSYPYRSLHPYIRRVYDAFGPQRMFWGSDLTKLKCSYRQAVTMYTEEIPWLNAEDKEWIMGRGLLNWLDWQLPS